MFQIAGNKISVIFAMRQRHGVKRYVFHIRQNDICLFRFK